MAVIPQLFEVAYLGRKKRKTTNSQYLIDRQGLPLALSSPIVRNHNDLYEIENASEEMFSTLGEAQISTEGLFFSILTQDLIPKIFVQFVTSGGLFPMLHSIIVMEKTKMNTY